MKEKNWHVSQLETTMKYKEVSALYRNAIMNVKTRINGSVVLDLSLSGGLFSLFAIAAGAKRCYVKVASTDDIATKTELYTDNHCSDKIILFTDQRQVRDSVYVILNQAYGQLPFVNGKILEVIEARDKLLVSDGIIIPHEINFLIGALEDPNATKEMASDWQFPYGITFNHALQIAGQCITAKRIDGRSVANDPVLVGQVNLLTMKRDKCENFLNSFDISLNRNCTVHGFIFCFDVNLMSSRFTNWPGSKRVLYEPNVFTLPTPIKGEESDLVRGSLNFHAKKNSITVEGSMTINIDLPLKKFVEKRLREIHYEL